MTLSIQAGTSREEYLRKARNLKPIESYYFEVINNMDEGHNVTMNGIRFRNE